MESRSDDGLYFANAVYSNIRFGKTTIAICSTKQLEEKWKDRMDAVDIRCSMECPIAEEIMKAAATKTLPCKFSCNGEDYILEKYTARPEERFYNKFRENHVERKEPVVSNARIYVYSERCRCTSCYFQYGYDSIENICGLVPLLDAPGRVEVDVQKCRHCGNYFIDGQSLAQYEEKYGLLKVQKKHITGNEGEFVNPKTYYKPSTILSENGYSTRVVTSERRRILTYLIQSGKSSKAEIKSILSSFIYHRSGRFPEAAAVWNADLEFLNQLNLENQDVVIFK